MSETIDIGLKYQMEIMDEADLLHAWQIRCDEMQYHDDDIFPMDEFDEMMNGNDASFIAFRIHHGDFNPHHEFFRFNGYGNLESSYYLSHFIDMNDLANEIAENDDLADALIDAGILEEWRDDEE